MPAWATQRGCTESRRLGLRRRFGSRSSCAPDGSGRARVRQRVVGVVVGNLLVELVE